MESLMGSKIGHYCWTGEQGAVVVVAAEGWSDNEDHEWLRVACWDAKRVFGSGAWPLPGRTISNPDSWIFLLTATYLARIEDHHFKMEQAQLQRWHLHTMEDIFLLCMEILGKTIAKLRWRHFPHIDQLTMQSAPSPDITNHISGFTINQSVSSGQYLLPTRSIYVMGLLSNQH